MSEPNDSIDPSELRDPHLELLGDVAPLDASTKARLHDELFAAIEDGDASQRREVTSESQRGWRRALVAAAAIVTIAGAGVFGISQLTGEDPVSISIVSEPAPSDAQVPGDPAGELAVSEPPPVVEAVSAAEPAALAPVDEVAIARDRTLPGANRVQALCAVARWVDDNFSEQLLAGRGDVAELLVGAGDTFGTYEDGFVTVTDGSVGAVPLLTLGAQLSIDGVGETDPVYASIRMKNQVATLVSFDRETSECVALVTRDEGDPDGPLSFRVAGNPARPISERVEVLCGIGRWFVDQVETDSVANGDLLQVGFGSHGAPIVINPTAGEVVVFDNKLNLTDASALDVPGWNEALLLSVAFDPITDVCGLPLLGSVPCADDVVEPDRLANVEMFANARMEPSEGAGVASQLPLGVELLTSLDDVQADGVAWRMVSAPGELFALRADATSPATVPSADRVCFWVESALMAIGTIGEKPVTAVPGVEATVFRANRSSYGAGDLSDAFVWSLAESYSSVSLQVVTNTTIDVEVSTLVARLEADGNADIPDVVTQETSVPGTDRAVITMRWTNSSGEFTFEAVLMQVGDHVIEAITALNIDDADSSAPESLRAYLGSIVVDRNAFLAAYN